MRTLSLFILIALLLPIPSAIATGFTDVPSDYKYAKAIYGLQKEGVVKGNPDGTFAPERNLNRAEVLTMIFRAADIEIRPVLAGCMPDVPQDAWFSEVICTAIEQEIVKGYPDGLFRPGQFVNRVELLKMILNALGFTIPPLTQQDRLSLDFLGVTHGSWYAPFLHRALALDLIPPDMLANNRFNPGTLVTRGQAAEILYRALNAEDRIDDEGTVLPTGAVLMDLPIDETGQTEERGAIAFAFDLTHRGTVSIEATSLSSSNPTSSCFLYLLDESGFSNRFWVGYQEGPSCMINADLSTGRYQVEVRTESEGDNYTLSVESTNAGDGNDGFISAINISVDSPTSGKLDPDDLTDWYRFFVRQAKKLSLTVSGDDNLPCAIYPDDDVDLFGEEGPQCNATKPYTYPPGTYYVSIQRIPPKGASYAYVIELTE